MTDMLLVPIIAASIVGSVHCAAMCGSFVAACATTPDASKGHITSQLTYNLGRLVAYTTLGVLAGSLGKATDLASVALGTGRVAAIVTGTLMIFWGLCAMLESQGVRALRFRLPNALLVRITALLASAAERPPAIRAGLLGLSSALLPCGWLYAFVLSAAGTAKPVSGALVMAAFWLGTLPMMLGLGVVLRGVLTRLRAHIPLLSACVIFGVGVLMIVGRINIPLAVTSIQHERTSANQTTLAASMPADCPLHRKAK